MEYLKQWLCLLLCLLQVISRTKGHGRLIDPPARGTMWRLGFDTPSNYNDHELFCGGFAQQWEKNKGRCGVCGDPWDLPRPRPNESGGIFGTGIISRVYREGEVITVTVHLTANHLGWFEFRLCQNNKPKEYIKQSCLNKHVLQLADQSGTRYRVKEDGTGLFRINLRLPEDVTCTNCVLQWHYTAGNNWGDCENGRNKVGCGPQEVFRGCSDIAIFSEEDQRYHHFQNLTRLIDFKNDVMFDTKTGYYDGDGSGEEKSEETKEKLAKIQLGEKLEEKKEGSISSNSDKVRKPPNGQMYVKLRWGYNRKSNKERNNRIKNGEFQYLLDKFRNPNYFPEDGQEDISEMSQKYVSSDSFRNKIDEASSKITEAKNSLVQRRKVRVKRLRRLLDKPNIDEESAEIFKRNSDRKRSPFVTPVQNGKRRPNRYLSRRRLFSTAQEQQKLKTESGEIQNYSDETDQLKNKISNVIFKLLNLTVSSSSYEASEILDKVSDSLSDLVARNSKFKNKRLRSLAQSDLEKNHYTKVRKIQNRYDDDFTTHHFDKLGKYIFNDPSPESLSSSLKDLESSRIAILLNDSPASGYGGIQPREETPVVKFTVKDFMDILKRQHP